jgi:3-hydroxymyristoyl/3-hydroxydecanoyl-(acyl carrier protein) dehydratase
MRWRFLDRIETFTPWVALSGIKTISFEEYSLMKPFGRKGEMPELFAIEACVASVQWLVMSSSEFEQTALLVGADNFALSGMAGMGDVLRTQVAVQEKSAKGMVAKSTVQVSHADLASGTLEFELVPLEPLWPSANARKMWDSLYGAA